MQKRYPFEGFPIGSTGLDARPAEDVPENYLYPHYLLSAFTSPLLGRMRVVSITTNEEPAAAVTGGMWHVVNSAGAAPPPAETAETAPAPAAAQPPAPDEALTDAVFAAAHYPGMFENKRAGRMLRQLQNKSSATREVTTLD